MYVFMVGLRRPECLLAIRALDMQAVTRFMFVCSLILVCGAGLPYLICKVKLSCNCDAAAALDLQAIGRSMWSSFILIIQPWPCLCSLLPVVEACVGGHTGAEVVA